MGLNNGVEGNLTTPIEAKHTAVPRMLEKRDESEIKPRKQKGGRQQLSTWGTHSTHLLSMLQHRRREEPLSTT